MLSNKSSQISLNQVEFSTEALALELTKALEKSVWFSKPTWNYTWFMEMKINKIESLTRLTESLTKKKQAEGDEEKMCKYEE